jgi:integrase
MTIFRRKFKDGSGKEVLSPHWTIEFTHLGVHHRENSGMSDKKAAKALEAQRRQEIADRLKAGKAPTIPLGEACRRYYNTKLKTENAKPKKLQRDLGYLAQLTEEFGAHTLLTAIRGHDVAKWRDALITNPRPSRAKPVEGEPPKMLAPMKPASVNRLYGLLRAIINCARDEWHLDAPTWKLKQLKTGPDRVRYLTEADEQKLLLAMAPHVLQFIVFLMDSGCRKGEAENLTWDRISWEGDRAVVRLYATETKSDKARQVPLTMRASALLRDLQRRCHNRSFVFWYETKGKTRRIGNVRKPFETALKRAGVRPVGGDDFHIHDCRHHFASRLAQRGASLHQIKELLGHTDIKTTLRYSHLCRSNLDSAVALLDSAVYVPQADSA